MEKTMRRKVEATDDTLTQDSPVDISVDGNSNVNASDGVIETVSGATPMKKAEALAFLEEPVEILVHDSSDRNSVPIVQVGVNGKNQFLLRGKPMTVRRKYVEVLARSKHTNFTQTKHYNDRNGDVSMRMNPHKSLKYPFSVIHDQNPKGAEWLRGVLAE